MTRATAVLAISLLCCGARVLPAQSRELLGQGVKAYQALEYDAAAALLEQRLGRDAASAPADNGSYLVRVTPRTLTADGPRARQVLLEVKQERPDTLAWPPPLTTPPLLPERTSSGPAFRSLAAGLVAGAAAVALPSIMARGKDATGARFAVGAAVGVAGFVGFFAHKPRPLAANVRANASQRDAWKKKLDAVKAENATRLRTVRLVVRAGPETIAERGSE